MSHKLPSGLPKSEPLSKVRKESKSALRASSLFIYEARIKAAEKEYMAMQEKIAKM